jgi:clan AA aspartic protease
MVIEGEFSARREVTLSLTIFDARSEPHEIPVVLDTGFDGFLTLPDVLLSALRLQTTEIHTVLLGDGTERDMSGYQGRVRWLEQERVVDIIAAEGMPLIGIGMVYGLMGTFHFADGGPAVLFRP